MTITELGNWPIPHIEQALYIQKLQDAVTALEVKRTDVTVVKTTGEPTQEEWEAAWVETAVLPPPIPVGTRLVWVNPTTQKAVRYTVTNDIATGTDSSHIPIPFISRSRSKSSFRLLAVGETNKESPTAGTYFLGHHNIHMRMAGSNYDTTVPNIMLHGNWKYWIDLGLVELMAIFRLRASGNGYTPTLTLNLQGGRESTEYDPVAFDINLTDGVDIFQEGQWYQFAPGFSGGKENSQFAARGVPLAATGGGIIDNSAGLSDADFFNHGYVYIQMPTLVELAGIEQPKPYATGAFGLYNHRTSSTWGATTTYQGRYFNVCRMVDTRLAGEGFFALGDEEGVGSADQKWQDGSKIWIYGIFANNALPSELVEDIGWR